MHVQPLVVGPLAANAYLVWTEGSPACAILDPGGDAPRLIEAVETRALEPAWVLLTHMHVDHFAAAGEVLERFGGARLGASAAEGDWGERPTLNLSYFLGASLTCRAPDRALAPGDTLEIGALSLEAVDLAGHTPGGLGFLAREGGEITALFTGDALFAGNIGRTDFPGSSHARLIESLKTVLAELPPDIEVYPGHGEATTVGTERETNSFLA